jgi:hypothetical protein
MARAEDYRRYAAECVALADRVQDPGHRLRLLEMASAFHKLAAKAAAEDDQTER